SRDMINIMSSSMLLSLLEKLPGRELKFAPGEAVFHLGGPVKSLHLVRSGTIHLARYQDNGSALFLQKAEQGAILAEASLYSAHYHCGAVAETYSVTWAISQDEMARNILGNPILADAWSRHLAHEVQRARLHSEILSLKTVAARLNAWIDWHGALPEKGLWSSVAYQIGVSPEALYREIAKRRKSMPGT
ncbi:MAG: cAMP-binding protein, partial [Sneathiella sp.]